MEHSRYSHLMVAHDPGDVTETIEDFKKMSSPRVLVSPSMGTGYDFPMESAEYAIIGKIPYPDTRDPVIKARHELDKTYTSYMAMQTLVQSCGRHVRSEDDRGETLICDDNILWFMGTYGKFAPDWFRRKYKRVGSVPTAPPKLNGGTR